MCIKESLELTGLKPKIIWENVQVKINAYQLYSAALFKIV